MIPEDHIWCPPSGHIHVSSGVITNSLYQLNVRSLGESVGLIAGEISWSDFKLEIKMCCVLVKPYHIEP